MTFAERLLQPAVILLDGATGSELERRGLKVTLPLWSAVAFLSQDGRSVLRDIHADYVRAGSEVITANTFRTNYRTLKRADLRHKVTAWTKEAVDIVRRAVDDAKPDREIFVAGSVAPLEDCYQPELAPPDAEMKDEHRRHIDNLYEARVDLFLIEAMNTIREASIAADYAIQTGKPVVVSFIAKDADHLLGGESLSHAGRLGTMLKVAGVMINCVAPALLGDSLATLRTATSLPIGGYANLLPTPGGKVTFSPDEHARLVQGWIEKWSLKFVGGCCGSTPDHIKALAEVIHAVA